MTFFEFNQKFPTEQAAIEYFYKIRYDGILACPHCESKVNLYRTVRQKVCICHFCENTFSPFVGIIFRKSTTDLRKWFYAIHLVLNAKRAFPPVIFSVLSFLRKHFFAVRGHHLQKINDRFEKMVLRDPPCPERQKGISACHLQREIGTIYRTAWRTIS